MEVHLKTKLIKFLIPFRSVEIAGQTN